MTEYLARKEYTYQGGDAKFTIPFPYIDKTYIKVYVNGTATSGWTLLNESQLQVISPVLANGDSVVVARQTPITDKLVTFTDTSILNEDVQNLAQDQVFDAIQEVYDNEVKFELDVTDTFDDYKTSINNTVDNYMETSTEQINTLTDKVTTAENSIENRAVEILNAIDSKGNNVKNDVDAKGQYWNTVVADHNLLYDECVGDTTTIEIPSNQYVQQAGSYASAASTSATQAANSANNAANSANQANNTYNSISAATTNSLNTINSTKSSAIADINNRGQYWNTVVANHNLLYDEVDTDEETLEIATTHHVEQAGSYATAAGTSATNGANSATSAYNYAGSAAASATSAANTYSSISSATTASLNSINSAKTSGIDSVNAAKTSAINYIDDRGQYWNQTVANHNLLYDEVVGDSTSIEIPTNQYVEQAQEYASIAASQTESVIQSRTDAITSIGSATTTAITSINSATTSAKNNAINDINTNGQYWVNQCADNNMFYEEVTGTIDIIIN